MPLSPRCNLLFRGGGTIWTTNEGADGINRKLYQGFRFAPPLATFSPPLRGVCPPEGGGLWCAQCPFSYSVRLKPASVGFAHHCRFSLSKVIRGGGTKIQTLRSVETSNAAGTCPSLQRKPHKARCSTSNTHRPYSANWAIFCSGRAGYPAKAGGRPFYGQNGRYGARPLRPCAVASGLSPRYRHCSSYGRPGPDMQPSKISRSAASISPSPSSSARAQSEPGAGRRPRQRCRIPKSD